jgi:hypothetical protein
VTLVDRGATQLIGTTPISASLDPSRSYDLVFSAADHPTRIEHVDARTTRHVSVALGARTVAASVRPADPAARRGDPAEAAPPAKKAERRAEPPAGDGTLMISSKPPCEIVVDGVSTGLLTPQRALTLPAGRHKITLVNDEKEIRKTISVQVAADRTEKIIEDLMTK